MKCDIMNKIMKKLIIWFLVFSFSFSLFAEYNSLGIPDSAEVRKGLEEAWFEAPLESVRNNNPEIYYNKVGEEFQVRMEESESTYNIFVSPHATISVNVYSDKGVYTKQQDVYPGDAPGSWVLIKDKKTGKPLRIRYYFLPDSEVFVQFSPYNRTSICDLVIFGNYAVRGVPTGVPFDKFYSASFDEMKKITKKNVPWNYVSFYSEDYHSVNQMASVIREKLPEIVYHADAMIDENGDFVELTSGKKIRREKGDDKKPLSSAGFLKWVADGLVEPLAGGKLKRYPLLAQTVEVKETGYQGVLSQKYSLSFALDFVRNLSSAVLSVATGSTYKYNESGVDVTTEPFATGLSDKGIVNTVTFIKDTGYNVNCLKSLLYVLASTEPGTIYFSALRQTDYKTPEVKVFNNCVILMPYFETNGRFNCYVFMNGTEMTLEDFINQYNNDFIYLTRVRSSEQFFPE